MIQKSGKLMFTVALLAGTILPATPAFAQATRTWVSGVGDDANPCSRTAPCKTFAGAISKTADKGEINCIDSGGYGTLTITKNITIDCPGVMAGVLAGGVNGFTVNAAGVVVNLRNLTVNGAGFTTGNGIRIVAAGEVNIDNVVVENFAGTATNGRALAIETAANVTVSVRNSRFTNNGAVMIDSNPTAGVVTLTLDHVQINHGGATCIDLENSTTARISNSEITDCAPAAGGAGITARLTNVTTYVANSVISGNAYGIYNGTSGAPTTRLYATVITNNNTDGLHINAGSVISHGNNGIRGNVGNETPTSNAGTQ
jgi:hypothetical protein